MAAPTFCPYCGAQALARDQVFCGSCGRSFPSDVPSGQADALQTRPGSGQPADHQPGEGAAATIAGGQAEARLAGGPVRRTPDTSAEDLLAAAGERLRKVTGTQWVLISGVGQALGAVFPWVQTSMFGAAVGPLTGIGTHWVFLVALVAAIAAVASSAVMAFDAVRAEQKLWRNWFLFASIATLVCVGLTFLSFMATRTYGLASPGIGLLAATAAAIVGIVALVRSPVR